jgi:hypothetical protein
LNGLNPSPTVEKKFNPQNYDAVAGNDLCARVFGSNAAKRHRMFKLFFTVQNPYKSEEVNQSKHPYQKVNSFLRWIKQVSVSAWNPGKHLSGDEQTIGFQGRHHAKQRITYKSEGDGFQCDAICDQGYTYNFYFRNAPPPEKYIKSGWSPLHARMLYMMEQLENKYHCMWMDNLYLSAKFVKGCYNHPNKILLAGVCRKGMRGVPECVIQPEAKPAEVKSVRGTVKAAVLKGDDDCPNMIALSLYDAKPVYFLSMIHTDIKWVTNTNRVYCRGTSEMEDNKFLRLNINTDYNNKMNSVDSADQLRNSYRFDHWLRFRKWWWSIFFWGFGVLMVNAYVAYRKYNIMQGKKKSELLDHYQFRKAIAMAWLDPELYDQKGADTVTPPPKSSKRKRRGEIDGIDDIDDLDTRLSVGTRSSANNPIKKARKVTDKSLDPCDGEHRTRLIHNQPHWLVEPVVNRPRCALHRWAADLEEKVNVFLCAKCQVHLCVHCFKTFHTQRNLVDKKDEICNALLDKKKKRIPSKQSNKSPRNSPKTPPKRKK